MNMLEFEMLHEAAHAALEAGAKSARATRFAPGYTKLALLGAAAAVGLGSYLMSERGRATAKTAVKAVRKRLANVVAPEQMYTPAEFLNGVYISNDYEATEVEELQDAQVCVDA
jgi:hypothetical protein